MTYPAVDWCTNPDGRTYGTWYYVFPTFICDGNMPFGGTGALQIPFTTFNSFTQKTIWILGASARIWGPQEKGGGFLSVQVRHSQGTGVMDTDVVMVRDGDWQKYVSHRPVGVSMRATESLLVEANVKAYLWDAFIPLHGNPPLEGAFAPREFAIGLELVVDP